MISDHFLVFTLVASPGKNLLVAEIPCSIHSARRIRGQYGDTLSCNVGTVCVDTANSRRHLVLDTFVLTIEDAVDLLKRLEQPEEVWSLCYEYNSAYA